MSVSDIGWPRLLYTGSGLSLAAAAILTLFVIPPFNKDIIPGSEWILPGIQLFIAAMLFATAYKNKREGCLTRLLLVIVGTGVILLGLMGFAATGIESEQTLFWKSATRVCAIDEFAIGIIAFYACI